MRSDFKNQDLDLRIIGEESNSLRDLLSIFFRWKWHSIFMFFLVFVFSIVITMLMKEKYTSEAKILVKPGRESIVTDPSVASENSTVIQTISQNREDEVASEMAVLTSYELIESIVEEMGPEVFLARPDEIEIEDDQIKSQIRSFRVGVRNLFDWMGGALVALDIKSSLSPHSKAAKVIQKNLEVISDGESNIISIAFRSQNPHLSQKTLKRYMDLYQQHHVDVHKSAVSPEFYEGETKYLLDELLLQEKEAEAFKLEYDISEIQMQRQDIIDQIAQLRTGNLSFLGRHELEAQIESTKAQLAVLEEIVQKYPETIELSRTEGLHNFTLDTLKPILLDLQIKESDKKMLYQDENRALQNLRKQIQMAEEVVSQEKETRTTVTHGLNENLRQFQFMYDESKTKLESYQASLASLNKDIAVYEDRLRELTSLEYELKRKQRSIDLMEEDYKKYHSLIEQAKILQEMDKAAISNVKLVQTPTLPIEPSSPNKVLNIFLGLCLGVFASFVIALILEHYDHKFTNETDVEKILGLPILTSITDSRK